MTENNLKSRAEPSKKYIGHLSSNSFDKIELFSGCGNLFHRELDKAHIVGLLMERERLFTTKYHSKCTFCHSKTAFLMKKLHFEQYLAIQNGLQNF